MHLSKIAFILAFFFVGLQCTQAQIFKRPSEMNLESKTDKIDPEARALLKKMKKKYESYTGIQSSYELTIDNRETKETQNGSVTQLGGKFHVKNDGNEIFCDGETIALYTRKNNTVQLNNYEPEEEGFGGMSPSDLMRIYEKEDEFTYAITNETSQKYNVEFKPKDKDAEFFKIRIEVARQALELDKVIIFNRDGTTFTLDIQSIKSVNPAASAFVFNKNKYPGVKIEDLRD